MGYNSELWQIINPSSTCLHRYLNFYQELKDRVSDYPLTSLLYNIDWDTQTLQITYLDQTLSTIRIDIIKPKYVHLLHNCKLPLLYQMLL